METGKGEYAPDYSRKNWTAERAAIARAEAYRIKSEHARLKDVVVDAAKVFTADGEREKWDRLVSFRELCRKVDALLAFEAEHEIGDKQ